MTLAVHRERFLTATDLQRELLQRLRGAAGDAAVITDDSDLRYLSEDALRGRGAISTAPVLPLAVVRPADAPAVARTLAAANATGIPVVPYGAGTGLMGGARSVEPGIVLDTSALGSVEVRAADRLVWAGAGAVLARVDEALRKQGLCLGHDPWTFPVASVGGPVGTNGLGYKGGRYGGMADQVVALEVALADGTLFRTVAVPRHSTGPDLARLFIGAEGTLAVVTAAALKAFPVPERLTLFSYGFDTFEAGFEAIDEICRLGMRPVLLDYGEEHAGAWREEEPPALHLGFEGFSEEVEACEARARSICEGLRGQRLPDSQARDLWENRHVIAERFARDRRDGRRTRDSRRDGLAFDYIHVALPASKVLEFRRACHEASDRSGVTLGECGLWTAPEMFSAVFTLPESQGGQDRLRLVLDELLMLAQDMGGSMEYCHGAGIRLAHLMEREHGPGLEVMRRLKAALDPNGILNPGKLGL
jgi:FAD/FMN-containing dehydrogenase